MEKLLNDHSMVDTSNSNLEKISPFELKDRLIKLAGESIRKTTRTLLNAGRGNPNWIATTPREALFVLGKFGIGECKLAWHSPEGIAGTAEKYGIASRFEKFLQENRKEEG